MVEINKTDLVLKALYDQRANNGMIPVIATFKTNNLELTIEELLPIIDKLSVTRFAIFQNLHNGSDQQGTITQGGIDFVLTNSFSKPGTSILKL